MAPTWQLFTAAVSCILNAQNALAAPLSNVNNLAIDLGYGIYQGAHNSTTQLNVWKGIRYAAPPTGPLRWQPPSAPTVSRNATVNATTFAPQCPQANPGGFSPALPSPSSEDCLFLNVYAPANVEAGSLLPVLVWIHGGGYGAGNGRQDMSAIINANANGFVAVAVQYRLGAFGFLSSDEVGRGGVANAGILDMAFALQWVQEHVGKFGGDAARVTISGESAGAGAVMLLGIAKNATLGTSLFSGIIAASPYLPPQYDFNASIPTQKYNSFVSAAGCANTTDSLTCLRAANTTTLQAANTAVNTANFYGNWAFVPVTEDNFITTLPSVSLSNNRVNGQHILVGNNANEGPLFVPSNITSTASLESWLQGAFPLLTPSDLSTILAAYPSSSSPSDPRFATTGLDAPTALDVSQLATGPQQRANNLYAEATFVCPSYWLSTAYTTRNRTAHHYQYSVPAALHGEDVAAYFGPAGPNQPAVFTDVFRGIWGGMVMQAKPVAAMGLQAELMGEPWAAWVGGVESRMLNLNTTGGVPYAASGAQGVNVTQFEGVGVRNAIEVVDAWSWEGGRGERCEVWRGLAGRVPI